MEEKNKLVADMVQAAIAKKGGSVAVITAMVKKYCPELQIDPEFLTEFAKQLSTAHSDLCSAEADYDYEEQRTYYRDRRTVDAYDNYTEAADTASRIASDPRIADAMAKAKYALSVIVYRESQCSEQESILDQQLIDIRESLRLDEFDPTDDERLDQEAMEGHPTYRDIKRKLYDVERLEQQHGHDRTLLDTAIKMYEKESALYHNSYDDTEHYIYWLEYEKGVAARLTKMDEMQKGGKK